MSTLYARVTAAALRWLRQEAALYLAALALYLLVGYQQDHDQHMDVSDMRGVAGSLITTPIRDKNGNATLDASLDKANK